MKVLQVQDYNNLMETKYHEATKAWKPSEGGFPQADFYFFSYNGKFRKTGYVAFDEHKAVLRPRKKDALRVYSLHNY